MSPSGDWRRCFALRTTLALIPSLVGCDAAGGLNVVDEPTPADPPPCASPMFRGNPQRSGTVDVLPRETPTLRWELNLRGLAVGEGHPWEAGYPHGAQPEDEAEPGGNVFIGPAPIHCDDSVIVATADGLLAMLDTAEGTPRWSIHVGGPIEATPAVVGSLILAPSLDGNLYAIDRDSGEQRWRFDLGADSLASPAIVDGRVFASTKAGRLLALDVADGTLHWERSLSSTVTSSASFEPGGEAFVVGERSGWLRSVRADDGALLWSVQTGGPILATAARDAGHILVGSWDNLLWALDPAGQALWTAPFGANVTASAAVARDRVFVGSWDWTLRALALSDGRELWARIVDSDVLASPQTDGDTLVAATETGRILGVDAPSGELLWEIDQRGRTVATPGFGQGVMYTLGINGDLRAWAWEAPLPGGAR